MGLARDLTMGTRRSRTRTDGSHAIAALRKLVTQPAPDAAAFRMAILRVGASPTRLRPAEGATYNAACARYREITGERIGPETGTY